MKAAIVAAALLTIVVLAACTHDPNAQQAVQLPTLAVLPSATSLPTITPTPSSTFTPSPTFTLTTTPTATYTLTQIPSPTSLPTITPTPSSTFTPSPTFTLTTTPTATYTLTQIPSPTEVCTAQSWWTGVQTDVHDFLDTATLAESTSRIAVASIVLQMQNLQHDYEHQAHPDCVSDLYYRLDGAMGFVVEGFEDFMAQKDDLVPIEFELATQYYWDATQMLLSLSLAPDYRMVDTATFIFGGDKPNAATATAMQQAIANPETAATFAALSLTPRHPATATAIQAPAAGVQLPSLAEINATATTLAISAPG